MKIVSFAFFTLATIFCFANDYAANSACIQVAERLGFIPAGITISALKSGEVITISNGQGASIRISRGFESKSHPGRYSSIELDGGSCKSTSTSNTTPGTYISSGLAEYIASQRVTKKDLSEAISVCRNAPAFKSEVEETLRLNRKQTDAIVNGTQ